MSEDSYETWWSLVLVIIDGLLCLVILVGNALVITAYNRIKRFQTNVLTHFFLIHLAISDLIVGVALAVKVISHFLYEHWTSNYKCVLQFSVVGKQLRLLYHATCPLSTHIRHVQLRGVIVKYLFKKVRRTCDSINFYLQISLAKKWSLCHTQLLQLWQFMSW